MELLFFFSLLLVKQALCELFGDKADTCTKKEKRINSPSLLKLSVKYFYLSKSCLKEREDKFTFVTEMKCRVLLFK